jgi:DNA-binding XRE family transcriptional regulator
MMHHSQADGPLLIALRKKIGLSQEKLGAIVGVTRLTVHRWESTGRIHSRHWATLVAYARSVVAGVAPAVTAPARGRPAKTYTLVKRLTKAEEGDLKTPRRNLWLPGHPDHWQMLEGEPTGVGDRWLYRIPGKPVAWLYELQPSGAAVVIGIVRRYPEGDEELVGGQPTDSERPLLPSM